MSRRRLLRGSLALVSFGLLSGCAAPPFGPPPPAKPPRVGALLWLGERGPSAQEFRDGLRELGYADGQNIVLEWRAHQGRADLLPGLVAELVGLPVDLLYTSGTPAALAARAATGTIPIVMTAIGDPVALGLVASLARPGGNVTGTASLAPHLSGKRLELLREAVPGLARVGALVNAAIIDRALDLRETREAARALGLALHEAAVRDPGEFEAAFAALAERRVEAIVVLEDFMFFAPPHRDRLAALAAQHRLPTVHSLREMADAGGLLAYGPNIVEAHRRGAAYVDKILKGARPAELPVEQPTTFELVINRKTAQALGLSIPESILMQATEIIQ